MNPKRNLHNTKGFLAQADVHVNSPTQTNNQNVNVIVSPLTKDRAFKIITDKPVNDIVNEVKHEEVKDEEPKQDLRSRHEMPCYERDIKLDEGLTDELENHLKTRSITSAQADLEEMQAIITDKDHLIEALSLIVDLYQNNPLKFNKFIIPEEAELINLLYLLTGAEEIQLTKDDPEVSCGCKNLNFARVSKIMVKKNDNTYNFKYSFPNVIQLLDNRNISWKFVC